MDHPNSPADEGTPTKLHQSLVATEGMEDHQVLPKKMEHPASPADEDTPSMPDQRLVAVGGDKDHQPHSKDVGKLTKPDTQFS